MVLSIRCLLAFTFLTYGYGKLSGGQFGINEEEISVPIQDLSLFKVSWYLFDHQPFKAVVGFFQILCAILLLYNRTVILGAFLFLPIISTILLMDLSFMPHFLAISLGFRLTYYILLDFLILWHYRERIRIIWQAIWLDMNWKSNFPIWAYVLIPFSVILLEVLGVIPKLIFYGLHIFFDFII